MEPPQRSLAEMNEDIAAEILLRIPPDERADLIRASVVCKPWLHVVSDPAFLRRYNAFHHREGVEVFFLSRNVTVRKSTIKFKSTVELKSGGEIQVLVSKPRTYRLLHCPDRARTEWTSLPRPN